MASQQQISLTKGMCHECGHHTVKQKFHFSWMLNLITIFIFVHLFVCVCPTMQFLKLQSTHQAVVRQSLCSCQAVVMQSCQAVVMQLSGSR